MSEVLVRIAEIVTKTNVYSTGNTPEGLQDEVTEIKYHSESDNYNKGRQFEGPCYVVFFGDNAMRRVVPKEAVLDVGVEVTKKSKKPKSPEEIGVSSSEVESSQE